ncbi:MAG TPA: PAS domain S-box protein [Saprospiraceae bacterium]|nr:PAS domain S-box protein [Saprospiraceae bacterium]HMP13701.1 PAS domain S-box protein [Saprospiraceae bacterium]
MKANLTTNQNTTYRSLEEQFEVSEPTEHSLLRGIHDAFLELFQYNDPQEALLHAFKIICPLFESDGVYILKYNAVSEDTLSTQVTFAMRQEGTDWQLLPETTIDFPLEREDVRTRVWNMVERGDLLTSKQENNPDQLNQVLQSLQINAYFSFRILIDSKLWGGLSLVSRTEHPQWVQRQSHLLFPFVQSATNLIVRYHAERKLQQQGLYLQHLIDLYPNFMFAKDREGRYTMANKALANFFGLTKDELIGKHLHDLQLPQKVADRIMRSEQAIFNTAQIQHLPFISLTDRQGAGHILEAHFMPIQDEQGYVQELLGIATDITEQKQSEKLLLAQKKFIETITATIPDLVLLVDIEMRQVNYFNVSNEMLGYQGHDAKGIFEYLNSRVHPDDQQVVEAYLHRLQHASDGEIITKDFRMLDQHGEWRHYHERGRVFSRHHNGRSKEFLIIIQDVTLTIQAINKIADSQRRYHNFIYYSYDGIYYMNFEQPIPIDLPIEEQVQWYYRYGYIEECNAAFSRMYGHDDPSTLMGLRTIDAHSGEDFETNQQSTFDFISSGYRVINSETIELDKYGNTLYILNHAIGIIEDGLLKGIWGTQQNITDKKIAEKKLEENQQILNGIVNALPDLKFRISSTGYVVDFYASEYENESMLVNLKAFKNKPLTQLLPATIADMAQTHIRSTILRKHVGSFEFSLPLEGQLAHYEARVSPMSADEVIITVRNITEKIASQLSLKEKLRELDEKNKQLTEYIESNLQLENFAYIASHDLREPLRTMRSFAQLVEKRYGHLLDEDGLRYLQFIVTGANNMNRLIEDLLNYARINGEKYVSEVINMRLLFYDIIQELSAIIKEKRAEIITDMIPDEIQSSRTHLRQVFQNLLVNAIKFSREGVPPKVQISCIEQQESWLFEVKDNGVGIPKGMEDKIFQLFKKLHQYAGQSGSGIGLALCKRIIEQQGGLIWVESELGQGSTFYFTIRKEQQPSAYLS